jgi:hypothetical protein
LADLDVLRELREVDVLTDWLDSQRVGEALKALIGTDPVAFLDREPDLADQVVEWGRHWRRIPRSERRERAQPLIPVLEARHAALWAQQARLLLSSGDHLNAAEPRLCRLIATLADGHLANEAEIARLCTAPTRTHQQVQHDAWDDYPAEREAAVDAHWAALSRRGRRHTSREQLFAPYDDEHLIVCDTCQIIYLKEGPNALLQYRCPHCDGMIIDWTDRASIKPLTRRLDDIRQRLTAAAPETR